MKRRSKFLPLLLFLGMVLAGCTNNPPVIRDVWWMPVTVKDPAREGLGRELMLYVQVDDEEGAGDMAELRLSRPDRELTWKAGASDWNQWEEKGVFWLGSSRFLSPGGESFEKGDYELVLEDKGGREDRIPLVLEGWLDEKELENIRVTLNRTARTVRIDADGGGWYLISGGESGEDAPSAVPTGRSFSPADHMEDPDDPFYLMMFDRSRMTCYREGPYFFSSVE